MKNTEVEETEVKLKNIKDGVIENEEARGILAEIISKFSGTFLADEAQKLLSKIEREVPNGSDDQGESGTLPILDDLNMSDTLTVSDAPYKSDAPNLLDLPDYDDMER